LNNPGRKEALTAVLFSFAVSLALAPWSIGIVFFLLFAYVWEAIYYTRCSYSSGRMSYSRKLRFAILLASILGWFIGRSIMRDHNPTDPNRGIRKFNRKKVDPGRKLVVEYNDWEA